MPSCASQILCTINERKQPDDSNESHIRYGLLRIASFPAAWGVSNNLGIKFWSLYGAIMEHSGCIVSELRLFKKKIRFNGINTENLHLQSKYIESMNNLKSVTSLNWKG